LYVVNCPDGSKNEKTDGLGTGNVYSRVPQIIQEPRSYLKILGPRKLI
jgi:hypothetical protein